MNKFKPKYQIFLLGFIGLLLIGCNVQKEIKHPPDLSGYQTFKPEIIKHNDSLFSYQSNYLTKNKYNQWELYIKGDALERGIIAGALMDSLIAYQEKVFVSEIDTLVPSKKKQKRLLGFLSWYNRKIYKYVPNEYKVEIYGLSQYMPEKYDYIGPAYLRSLYYHAAHDIGHALVDLSMVNECSSAAIWGGRTEDGSMLIGRNLDFYLNDQFAENRLILFVDPDEGIPFVSIAWPGMIGVVSGMNKAGLTITMNAGKSKIPLTAKEPISLLARDILEHASTIDEAIEIAKKSEVFVSESLMIGSAKDNKAVLIEKSPNNFGVYDAMNNDLVCTNHFQSEAYKNDKRNKKRIENGHSLYRYERMQQLLNQAGKLTPEKLAGILRNRKGLNDEKLGYGNEKAINQLLSHHGVIFKPQQKIIWIASPPYNEGAFTAYDLNEIFSDKAKKLQSQNIDSLTIPADPFLKTQDYINYEKYRVLDKEISRLIDDKNTNPDTLLIEKYRQLNPDFWEVHYKAGLLYYKSKNYKKAKAAFELALQKVVTTVPDKEKVKKILRKTEKKLK